ncbi:nesprin-2 [Osmerus mordax]|uniref:nesprin-2 n=1 Tax=Osmerus mordax TaxID=8014 RepID=UPI00350FDB1F
MERALSPAPTGSDTEWEEEEELMRALGLELMLEQFEPSELLVSPSHSPAPLGKTGEQPGGLQLGAWSQDGGPALELEGFVQLERRWLLWHEFMKEYSNLVDWLRLAERTAASAQVLYIAAKQELRKFENLLVEARARLVQLDSLARWNRTLVGHFQGAMRTRTVAMVRECGQRWDRLHASIEVVCRRLKHCVSLREQFECGREDVMVWLSEMDLRLSEVENLTGRSCCHKMKELQGTFQVAVVENASRLNELLDLGEALIQRSQPEDGEDIEAELQEVILFCARVFEGAGRLHTRLLSMRLVFEDDWVLIPAPDSGCPSETLLEEESSPPLDPQDPLAPTTPTPPRLSPRPAPRTHPDRHPLAPTTPTPPRLPPRPAPRTHPDRHPLAPTTRPHLRPPTLDHQVLEWDPSVDIGHSVSHDDADSSYFSANPGLGYRDEPLAGDFLKRRSYLSCLGSMSDITSPPADLISDGGCGKVHHRKFGSVGGACWETSTPSGASSEPVTFDPARISAWLGKTPRDDPFFSGPAPRDPGSQSCSRSVQTDLQCPGCHCMRDPSGHSQPCCHDTLEGVSFPVYHTIM